MGRTGEYKQALARDVLALWVSIDRIKTVGKTLVQVAPCSVLACARGHVKEGELTAA